MKTAAIYARVSSDQQKQEKTIASSLAELLRQTPSAAGPLRDFRGEADIQKQRGPQASQEALVPFGLHGLFSGAGLNRVEWKKIDGIPFYQNLGLADSVAKTVQLIRGAVSAHSQRPLFLNVYILAWSMTPSDLKQVVEQLGPDYQIVLPSTLVALLTKSIV